MFCSCQVLREIGHEYVLLVSMMNSRQNWALSGKEYHRIEDTRGFFNQRDLTYLTPKRATSEYLCCCVCYLKKLTIHHISTS